MRQKLRSRLTYANVMATIAVFIALGGTTYAATGGNFILGRSNSASSTTSLSSSGSGPALKATNTSIGTAGNFNVTAGHPPLTVNSGTKVANLNADKLDGKDSSAFLNSCPSPLTARYGRICAGSDGASRDFNAALTYCSGLGLRLPSFSEAVTLATLYDVPGVATDNRFWTDDWGIDASGSSTFVHADYVYEDASFGQSVVDTHMGTVCVTEPTNS